MNGQAVEQEDRGQHRRATTYSCRGHWACWFSRTCPGFPASRPSPPSLSHNPEPERDRRPREGRWKAVQGTPLSGHGLSRGLIRCAVAFALLLSSCSTGSYSVEQRPTQVLHEYGKVAVVAPFTVEGEELLEPTLKNSAVRCAAWIPKELRPRLADMKGFRGEGPTLTVRGSIACHNPGLFTGAEILADVTFLDEAGHQVARVKVQCQSGHPERFHWLQVSEDVARQIFIFIRANYDSIE